MNDVNENMLDKVRKLLAKAEAEGCTPDEAEALTAKASELMAKYGIDRARLAASRPETDHLTSKIIPVFNPWGTINANLLYLVAEALRCKCIMLGGGGGEEAAKRVQVFGFASDIERAEIMYTSLLLQMNSSARHAVPRYVESTRAWRRSWMLGFTTAVTARIREAEKRAAGVAEHDETDSGRSTALVLADRSVAVRNAFEQEYPTTRQSRVSFSGTGYGSGYRAGQVADIGGPRMGAGARPALSR